MTLKGKPATRTLLTAIALGLVTGIAAACHLAKVTPAAIGFFTFSAFLFGDAMHKRRRTP